MLVELGKPGDGLHHVGKLSGMAVMADGRWIGSPATRLGLSLHAFQKLGVLRGLLSELPGLNVLFLQHGGALRTVQLNPFQISRIGGRGGLEHADGSILKTHGGYGDIFDFEESVVRYVKECDLDGVICGHIHVAAIKDLRGTTYINCGDWVDSCTAILEHQDGRMELVEWGSQHSVTEVLAAQLAAEPALPQSIPAAARQAEAATSEPEPVRPAA